MTCRDCGMTVGWDCYCDNANGDYNRMLDEAQRRLDEETDKARNQPPFAGETDD